MFKLLCILFLCISCSNVVLVRKEYKKQAISEIEICGAKEKIVDLKASTVCLNTTKQRCEFKSVNGSSYIYYPFGVEEIRSYSMCCVYKCNSKRK